MGELNLIRTYLSFGSSNLMEMLRVMLQVALGCIHLSPVLFDVCMLYLSSVWCNECWNVGIPVSTNAEGLWLPVLMPWHVF